MSGAVDQDQEIAAMDVMRAALETLTIPEQERALNWVRDRCGTSGSAHGRLIKALELMSQENTELRAKLSDLEGKKPSSGDDDRG